MPEDVAHAASKVTEAPMPAHAGAAAALPSVSVDVQADLKQRGVEQRGQLSRG